MSSVPIQFIYWANRMILEPVKHYEQDGISIGGIENVQQSGAVLYVYDVPPKVKQ